MDTQQATEAFSALSQETRLRIYTLLIENSESGLPAGDISMILGVPQNTLSFHLSHLQRAGLVNARRAGRFIIYSPAPTTMKDLLRFMVERCCLPPDTMKKQA